MLVIYFLKNFCLSIKIWIMIVIVECLLYVIWKICYFVRSGAPKYLNKSPYNNNNNYRRRHEVSIRRIYYFSCTQTVKVAKRR